MLNVLDMRETILLKVDLMVVLIDIMERLQLSTLIGMNKTSSVPCFKERFIQIKKFLLLGYLVFSVHLLSLVELSI